MKNLKNIYKNKLFIKRIKFLEKSQYWSKEKLESYQIKKIKDLFLFVKKNIPFYKNYFKKKDITIRKINSLKDINIFPIVDKKIIQKNIKDFLISKFKKKQFYCRTTGGSTGTPLTIWSNIDHQIKDKANTKYYMRIFGLDINKYKSIRIYGDKIKKNLIKKKIFWSKKDNKLIMSAFYINEENLEKYIKQIELFKPKYIHSRASIMFSFAKLIANKNIKFKIDLKYIFIDGESINKNQRKLIENVFKTRLINIFGHTEGALVGHPCEFSDFLHFMPQNGFLELLDSNSNPIKKDGKKGNIIATGFNNKVLPLIRYRTGDIGVLTKTKCKCKRNYMMLKEVEGRAQDYIVDKRNNVVPLAPAMFNYNDMNWKDIEEFKIVQKLKGELELLLKLSNKNLKFSNRIIKYTKKKLKLIFGINFNLKVRIVEELKKTSIGKYRYLDQNLKINI